MALETNEIHLLGYLISEQIADFKEKVEERSEVDASTLITYQVACDVLNDLASDEEIDLMQERAMLLVYSDHREFAQHIHQRGLQLLGLENFILKAEMKMRTRLQQGFDVKETFTEIQTALLLMKEKYVTQFNDLITEE